MTQPTDLAGYAVYAEFQRELSTVQVLLTPEGLTSEFAHVSALMYRRQIHTTAPRATWKSYAISRVTDFDTVTGTLQLKLEYADKPAAALPADVGVPILGAYRIIAQLANQGFKLVKQLIVVEVSVADMTDLRSGRTPYKVLTRINKSRKALGFSDSLFAGK